MKSPSTVKLGQPKDKEGHAKEKSIKTLTLDASYLSLELLLDMWASRQGQKGLECCHVNKGALKVFTIRKLLVSHTISGRVDFPSKLKSLSVSCFRKVGL